MVILRGRCCKNGEIGLRRGCYHTGYGCLLLLRPSWGHVEPSWGDLGSTWEHLGPSWGSSWGHLGLLGAILVYLGPSWPFLGPSWAVLGRSLGHLGIILAHLGSSWAHLKARRSFHYSHSYSDDYSYILRPCWKCCFKLGSSQPLARFPFPCSDRFIFGVKNSDLAWEVFKK